MRVGTRRLKKTRSLLTLAMADGRHDGMKRKLKVDAAGRIVLPQPVRRQFHLESGALLELEIQPDAIVLRPETDRPVLAEENGLLIHDGEPSGELVDIVEAVRRRRDQDTAGPLA